MNHRTDEVNTDFIARSCAEHFILQLLALLPRPRIGALIDRDDELRDGSQDLEELGFVGFHDLPPSNAPARELDNSNIESSECREPSPIQETAMSSFEKSF